MKLDAAQVKQAMKQLDVQVLPEDHPAVPQLNNMFGDHTFFVDERGLEILEPADSSDGQTGEVINLADWSDAELTKLKPHEPEATGMTLVFEQRMH